jgi:hypothetical protein
MKLTTEKGGKKVKIVIEAKNTFKPCLIFSTFWPKSAAY